MAARWLPALMLASTLCLSQGQGLTQEELAIFETFGISVTEHSDTQWLLEHNGIPDHDVGDFPAIGNPNSIGEQNHDYYIPRTPEWLDEPGCLPQGTIAMSKSGVPFFNPYTFTGLNAVTNEIFDDCEGHPDPQSVYHYHHMPSCLYEGGNNELMGVSLDGYPIMGPKDENGVELTTADLDFCHGRWYNGRYQYHLTRDFPYIMACYRGQSTRTQNSPPGRRKRRDLMLDTGHDALAAEIVDHDIHPRFKRHALKAHPKGQAIESVDAHARSRRQGTRTPPPDRGPGGGGGQTWAACYAYCENPGVDGNTCMEPEYTPGLVANTPAPDYGRAPAAESQEDGSGVTDNPSGVKDNPSGSPTLALSATLYSLVALASLLSRKW